MSNTIVRKVLTSRDVASWPFLAVLVLLAMFLLSHSVLSNVTYTLTLDASFWLAAFMICLGHVLAFSLMPVIILKTRIITEAGLMNYAVVGLVTILIQAFLRYSYGSLSTLDCVNACVSTIMPISLQNVIFCMVVVVLFITYALFFVTLKKRITSV
jgi:hypothetical protein